MQIHIIDVGCGSMAIILNPDGTKVVLDCNLTKDNSSDILSYARRVLGNGSSIDVFINSHRDADHMRSIIDLHTQHPIKTIWDPDVPGTTTDSPEYSAYIKADPKLDKDGKALRLLTLETWKTRIDAWKKEVSK